MHWQYSWTPNLSFPIFCYSWKFQTYQIIRSYLEIVFLKHFWSSSIIFRSYIFFCIRKNVKNSRNLKFSYIFSFRVLFLCMNRYNNFLIQPSFCEKRRSLKRYSLSEYNKGFQWNYFLKFKQYFQTTAAFK